MVKVFCSPVINCLPWIYFFLHTARMHSFTTAMHDCNFCTIKFCPISVAVVINCSVRPFCMLKMPPLCHTSCTGAVTSCLAGSSGWEQSASRGLLALSPLPALPDGCAALSQGQDWRPQGGTQSRAPQWAALPLWQQQLTQYRTTDPLAELDITLLFVRYLAYSAIFFFTFTVATVNAARISSVRVLAVLRSHPEGLLSSPCQSYCSHKQQTVKWALH